MGRATDKAFTEIETFDDFRLEIQNSINYLASGCFDQQSAELSMKSLNDMDEKTQKKVLSFMRHVDRSLSRSGANKGNRFHKIPTIMAGCIYLTYYPEQIKDLTMEELTLLARFSVVEAPEFYENAVDYLGQELLSAVSSKHFDHAVKISFLDYAESKIREGEDKKAVAAYVRETPIETLAEEANAYENNILTEVGKYL